MTQPAPDNKYRYFVAFSWGKGTKGGQGNAEMVRDEPVTGMADINAIALALQLKNEFDWVHVLFWQRFDDPVIRNTECSTPSSGS